MGFNSAFKGLSYCVEHVTLHSVSFVKDCFGATRLLWKLGQHSHQK